MKKFDPRHIQLIRKFENLNDFDKPPDVDDKYFVTETESSKYQRKRSRVVDFQEDNSVHAQFGYTPSGQADELTH